MSSPSKYVLFGAFSGGSKGATDIKLTLLLLLLLPLAAETTTHGAAGLPKEPNEPKNPAALIARIMSSSSESGGVERLRPEDITRKLWRNRISDPGLDGNVETRTDLEELVQKLRSVRFDTRERPDPAQAPVASRGSGPVARGPSHESPVASHETRVTREAPPVRTLPGETSETLKRLLADPNQAHDPLEMAELLFLSGRSREAATLYEKALALMTPNDPATKEDRAWVLLQLGNCLRETDTARARSMYAKLIAEHPESPWVELAKAHGQLILWHEKVQPYQWITRAEPK